MPKGKLYFARRKPTRCPHCGQSRVVRIVYGEPDYKLFEAAQRGEVVLGGCCVTDWDPTWKCLACETEVYPEQFREVMKENPGAF